MPDVFCLSVHASYRCRHSGACCSSNWAIPVEAPLYRGWNETTRAGVIRRDDLPTGLAGLLRTREDGTCTFFDRGSRLCDIHRDYGHAQLPASCRQFPRVSLLDPRGVFVTLSHYCPTAADLLFEDTPIRLVVNPPAFPRAAEYDGLDARGAFPPLLRPGVLMDWDTLDAWDRFAFDRLDRETHDVDAAFHDLTAVGEALRRWAPADGPLAERLRMAIEATAAARVRERPALPLALDAQVRALTPAAAPALPAAEFRDAWTRWVEPVWPTFTRPLCRYVAAKLCGNWCWYQGDGLRTLLRSVDAALAIVRVEAARHGQRHGRMLDRSLLRESVRQADLLLVHLSSREALARHWSAAEAQAAEVQGGSIDMSTDDERKKALLTAEQYHVTQQKGTERAFTGKYWDTKTPGMYKCVVCGQELFDSDTKYDSGSGWPSFYQPADQSKVHTEDDRTYGMVRTEVTCSKCGAHLGHVFPDGPRPTGLRYCINSASLALDENKKPKE